MGDVNICRQMLAMRHAPHTRFVAWLPASGKEVNCRFRAAFAQSLEYLFLNKASTPRSGLALFEYNLAPAPGTPSNRLSPGHFAG